MDLQYYIAEAKSGIEHWKKVPGLPEMYEASNMCRVRTIDRTVWCNNKKCVDGGYWTTKSGRILSPNSNRKGYMIVGLKIGDKYTSRAVHRLVAQAFIPNPENKPQINHKNTVKDDNRLENLEWTTQLENMKHAKENGLRPRGQNHPKAKLTADQVYFMKVLLNCGVKQSQLARDYGITSASMNLIKNGTNWPHIKLEPSLIPTN